MQNPLALLLRSTRRLRTVAFTSACALGISTSVWGQCPPVETFQFPGVGFPKDAVALSGDLFAVGGGSLGDVRIYGRTLGFPGTWSEIQTLVGLTSSFGRYLDLDGETLVVSPNDTGTSTYIYERTGPGGSWLLARILPGAGRLSLSGDTLAVLRGSIHFYERDLGGPGNWGFAGEADVSSRPPSFGLDLDLDGDTLIVGAWTPSNEPGSAFVFRRTQEDEWILEKSILGGGGFGTAVSASGATVVVGIHNGGIRVYDRGANAQWDLTKAINTAAGNFFCLDGDRLVSATITSGMAPVLERNAGGPNQWGRVAQIQVEPASRGELELQGTRVVYLSLATNGSRLGHVFELAPALGIVGTETMRLGSPANPDALRGGQTTGPTIGQTWDPVIDHASFATSAVLDFLAVDLGPPINLPLGIGTLLCSLPPAGQLFTTLAGTPFAIAIPGDCSFVGMQACSQGGSFTPGFGIELTNAIDLMLGNT